VLGRSHHQGIRLQVTTSPRLITLVFLCLLGAACRPPAAPAAEPKSAAPARDPDEGKPPIDEIVVNARQGKSTCSGSIVLCDAGCCTKEGTVHYDSNGVLSEGFGRDSVKCGEVTQVRHATIWCRCR